jgi:hypothetical protein
MAPTKLFLISGLFLMMCLLPLESTNSEPASGEEKIASIRTLSNEAIARHDALGVVSFLAPEYQITTGKGLIFQGSPQEEAKDWKQVFSTAEDIVYVRTPKTIEVSTYLPRAAENGTWLGSWTTNVGRKEVGGSYAATWSKIDGEWKILSEVFVTLFCNGPGC